MQSLVDRFCPNIHDAAITAAAHDPHSGTVATADADGVVAIQRTGEAAPRLVFQPGGCVQGALALIRGGSLVAVGDNQGTIGLYKTTDGSAVFREEREGARGRVRAMRGVAINPTGSRLAAIAQDGLLRLWDLTAKERDAWRHFSGTTVEFDERGDRLLLIDTEGHPQLFDLASKQPLYMDKLQTPATHARFTMCGTMVLAGGNGGISLLRIQDGSLVASFATRGGSGVQNLILAPDGKRAAALTQRSVHLFSLPDLTPAESFKHGAPEPSSAAIWVKGGPRVGGSDGLMHGGGEGSLGPVTSVKGIGPHRILMHNECATVWTGDERVGRFTLPSMPTLLNLDRAGRLLAAVTATHGLTVHDCTSGKTLFQGGPETKQAVAVHVGGDVVSLQLPTGGLRWWHLAKNQGFSIPWPRFHTLSGSGTWIGVITPKGAVRVLDPSSGQDAIAPPNPLSNTPVRLLAFVNRSPELIVLDEDGVLGHYNLTDSVQKGMPANGTDILSINVPVDKIWGITGGRFAALRLPDADGSTILWVDLTSKEVVGEVSGVHRFAEVDAEHGRVLVPARSGAMLELDKHSSELRVLRSLTDDQWLAFGPNGILGASDSAVGTL